MINFNPKINFTTFHKEEAESLIAQRESRWLTLALNAALAQLAMTATGEELKGARRLIDTLLNLPDPIDTVGGYPVKELKTLDK